MLLVFDLDDTLYLERDFVRSGFRHVGAWVETVFEVQGFGERCLYHFEAGARGDIFNRAMQDVGLDPAAETVADLVRQYRTHDPDIALEPDAARYLSNSPFTIHGLITDGPEAGQAGKIAALGLASHIPHIRMTGAWPVGFGKPHPRAFEEMEHLAGPAAARMVYVADNPLKDFVTPRRRGWLTVQIMRAGRIHTASAPDEAHAPHTSISSLDDLTAALHSLVEQE